MSNNTFIITPSQGQTALDFMVGKQYLSIAIDSFLTSCKAKNLSKNTIKFYRDYLTSFSKYAEAQSVMNLQDIDPNFIRDYFLMLSDSHNPGGVHAAFRSIRAFMNWIEKEEMMTSDWKNPIKKVDAPKVPEKIMQPVPLEDVQSLVDTCKGSSFYDKRDKAIILLLLDTGSRAQEVCDLNLEDVDLSSGSVLIRQGKGRKPRYVYIDKTCSKALRGYLKTRANHANPALFVSKTMERLTYDGLRQIIQRRSKLAGLKTEPTLHNFRRQFALSMLNNQVDIFALQKLMGHQDIGILRRYLAQTTDDIRAAHSKGSPVERSLRM